MKSNHVGALVVEFAGIAGTGKTALMERVRNLLSQETLHVNPGSLSIWLIFRSVVSPARVFWSAWGLIAIARAKSSSKKGLHDLWIKFVRTQIKLWGCHGASGLSLVDHGFFQTFRSIYPWCKKYGIDWLANQLGRSSRMPHLVVLLEADAPSIIERRANRSKRLGVRELEPPVVQRTVEGLKEYRELAMRMAGGKGGFEVMVLDNGSSGNLDELAGMVADRIRSLTKNGSRAVVEHVR